MDQSTNGNKKIMAVIGLLVIVAVIGVGFVASSGKKDNTVSVATATPDSSTGASPAASSAVEAASTSGFKDGTYSATGTYNTPGGQESITVSLTVDDGKVTNTSATASGNDNNSKQYQSMFIANYKSQVVGKSLEDISLSRVSGSSLTSGGFNKAVSDIESQAKA